MRQAQRLHISARIDRLIQLELPPIPRRIPEIDPHLLLQPLRPVRSQEALPHPRMLQHPPHPKLIPQLLHYLRPRTLGPLPPLRDPLRTLQIKTGQALELLRRTRPNDRLPQCRELRRDRKLVPILPEQLTDLYVSLFGRGAMHQITLQRLPQCAQLLHPRAHGLQHLPLPLRRQPHVRLSARRPSLLHHHQTEIQILHALPIHLMLQQHHVERPQPSHRSPSPPSHLRFPDFRFLIPTLNSDAPHPPKQELEITNPYLTPSPKFQLRTSQSLTSKRLPSSTFASSAAFAVPPALPPCPPCLRGEALALALR